MTTTLSKNFAAALDSYRPTRLSRLLHSPLHLLRSKYYELYAKKLRVPVWRRATTFWGDEMQVVFPEHVSMSLYRYRFFERNLTQMMLNTLEPGMVFFDIGAHFGYYSLLAATMVGAGGSVHAFEPTPSTFEVLRRNTDSKSNIRINQLAMWSETATLQFRDYGVGYSGFNSILTGAVEDNMRQSVPGVQFAVQATTVDTYVAGTNVTPDFLKLDAEGAELNIVDGMEQTIRRARPIMSVEVGDDPAAAQSRSRRLLDTIIARGYRPFESLNGDIVPHKLLDKYEYENILLIPSPHS